MSLAMQYNMKRKRKAMGGDCYAGGGAINSYTPAPWNKQKGIHTPVVHGDPGTSDAGSYVPGKGYGSNLETGKQIHRRVLSEMKADKTNRKNLAEGGLLTDDGYQSECSVDCNYPCDVHMSDGDGYAGGGVVNGLHQRSELSGAGVSKAGSKVRYGTEQSLSDAKDMHRRVLSELKRDKRDRKFMSEGGKVANSDELTAGFMPNEFDDLDLRDDLESTYTGANSGDELGDEQEDDDRNDMVARIMRSWAKRAGHNPRPA